MDILMGTAGLGIAFLILAAILLYFIINSKGRVITKVILISLVAWYSLILVYTPSKLMGWPTNQPMPPNTVILHILWNDPKPGNEGGIYLWGVTKNMTVEKTVLEQLSYKNIFRYNMMNTPRVYRLPYTKKNYKYIKKLWIEARDKRYALMFRGSDAGDAAGFSESPLDIGIFEVVNPATAMRKPHSGKNY